MKSLKLRIKKIFPNYYLPVASYSRRRRAGFTFIEILVVATIIGLLTTIAAVTYQSANRKARDGKRKADLEQIRSALEMYRSDIGNYPATGNLSLLVSGDYIQEIPSDPTDYSYCYTSGGASTYTLDAHLEIDTGENYGSNCGGVCNYRVQNP